MQEAKYLLTIDQGTTTTRAILFDNKGNKIMMKQMEFTQITPKPGWVLHNPDEIYLTVLEVIKAVINASGIKASNIISMGITNQRETLVMWDKDTMEAVYPAICWQSRQSEAICDKLIRDGYADVIHEKTGLLINPYFSASKIKWIFDNVLEARKKRDEKRLLCGTIDTYLLYRLTNGQAFKTDYTNASRTMLFNINTLEWDPFLLKLFDVPREMLATVCDSSHLFGYYDYQGTKIKITSLIGDQQASLFGHTAFNVGDVKITYGTGAFILLNIGDKPILSKKGLLTTIAYKYGEHIAYALEGSVFVAGSAVSWLRDGLNIISSSSETEACARKMSSSLGVYFVPSFVGMGSPYWDNDCRGAIFGLTRGTTKDHLIRATLEGICYQVLDALKVMEKEAHIDARGISVDGGASVNNYLLQFEADITDKSLYRPKELETTAMGAAYLAGLYTGFYPDEDYLTKCHELDKIFLPNMHKAERKKLIRGWNMAVKATRMFKA